MPTAAAVLLIVAVLQWPSTKVSVHPAAPVTNPVMPVAPVAAASANLAPTVANYQQAADESLEKLDALLGDEGKSAGSSAPIYTAASRSLSF